MLKEYELNWVALVAVVVVLAGGVVAVITVAAPGGNPSKSSFAACEKFPAETVACENAVRLALEKYPGTPYTVDKIEVSIRNRTSSFWLVGVDLEKTLEIAGKQNASRIKVKVVEGSADIYELVG